MNSNWLICFLLHQQILGNIKWCANTFTHSPSYTYIDIQTWREERNWAGRDFSVSKGPTKHWNLGSILGGCPSCIVELFPLFNVDFVLGEKGGIFLFIFIFLNPMMLWNIIGRELFITGLSKSTKERGSWFAWRWLTHLVCSRKLLISKQFCCGWPHLDPSLNLQVIKNVLVTWVTLPRWSVYLEEWVSLDIQLARHLCK